MNQSSVCYVFGAGEHYGPPPDRQSGDTFIAADGGLSYLTAYHIVPDLVVGDFDSLPAPPPVCDSYTVALPREKDDTDMAAALREGWERGYRVFYIYGGTGGRLDHTLANIQCLADLAGQGGRGYLFDRDTVITAIHNDHIAFPENAQGIVSVFAHSDIATGVYERGLKYPLSDATLRNTYPLGVSNEFAGVAGSISVQCGTLIVIYPQNTRETLP